ncbi:MAG TPA: helix-turn-helix domain-containing protein [Candidatus Limnocylindrales bacterium]|nr:helix-turn-helix domain-containing protein [Candidatus Limnocylindrales bacterium]
MNQLSTSIRLDPKALRVLAHPLRSRLLTALRIQGPATATALARELDTNTGATSYHLRKLASVGLVEETEDGRGRERWWRASTASHEWRERDLVGDPDAEAASDWLRRHYFQAFAERYERWLDAVVDEAVEWRDAAESGDAEILVSPERLREFEAELQTLIERYQRPSPVDRDARRVAVYFHTFPVAPVDEGAKA